MNARLDIGETGCFVTQAWCIGAADEEIQAMSAKLLSPERAKQLEERLHQAAIDLARSQPVGWC